MVLLDRSQQIMTIVGLIANIGTSITLIRNGKVSILLKKFYFGFLNASVPYIVWARMVHHGDGLFRKFQREQQISKYKEYIIENLGCKEV